MADELIDVSAEWAKRAYVDDAKYKAMYEASTKDPVRFWAEHGKRIDWIKPFSADAVRDVDYTGDVHIRWLQRASKRPTNDQRCRGRSETPYVAHRAHSLSLANQCEIQNAGAIVCHWCGHEPEGRVDMDWRTMEPGGSPGEDWGGARGYRNRPELRAWFTSAALSASYAVQTAGTNELQDCSAAVLRE